MTAFRGAAALGSVAWGIIALRRALGIASSFGERAAVPRRAAGGCLRAARCHIGRRGLVRAPEQKETEQEGSRLAKGEAMRHLPMLLVHAIVSARRPVIPTTPTSTAYQTYGGSRRAATL